ncbi:hypothetical protein [Alkalihalobacillus sp. LMS39]|uniref:hypothetical protein n=1 Tax=Alkalihalobacillus sp. LMS39 TaxID=2924032 RepID=UPI001FB4ED87|nr:hypothetical protein [Alkalihalobacillus sp. LMS39]UOE96045.1 hypothetical protein MM271_10790 [Alkalihalobacillus sp. LMS39]
MSYKIIKIIDEYMVVVNVGAIDGANIGDLLEIYQIGEEIKDPDTNEPLGTLDLIKGKIKIINVYKNFSLCKTAEYLSSPIANVGVTMSKMLGNYDVKALNINTKQVSGGYSEGSDLIINLGDPVRILKSKHMESILMDED